MLTTLSSNRSPRQRHETPQGVRLLLHRRVADDDETHDLVVANSFAARAAAHGAHNGTSISPSKSELYRPVITASNTSQTPRSAGCAREQKQRQGRRRMAFSARSITARTSGRFATSASASKAGRTRSSASVM